MGQLLSYLPTCSDEDIRNFSALGLNVEQRICKPCYGSGTILGMDGSTIKCPHCYGKGFIFVKVTPVA